MLRNINITTVLLLGVLIFVIYILMKPTVSGFENASMASSTPSAVISPQQVQKNLDQGLPIVSNDVIHQILAESENTPTLNNGSTFNKEENVHQTSVYNYLANDEDVAEGA